MKNNFKTIAVMTSGGDAPGMNAVIRAVVRTAVVKGINVLAINGGYEGIGNRSPPRLLFLWFPVPKKH